MIIKVDGWLYRLSEETVFVEFTSSPGDKTRGIFIPYDKNGKQLKDYKSLGLPEEIHWTKRVKDEN